MGTKSGKVLTRLRRKVLCEMYSINYDYGIMSRMVENMNDSLTAKTFVAIVDVNGEKVRYLTINDFEPFGDGYACKDDYNIYVQIDDMPEEVEALFALHFDNRDAKAGKFGFVVIDDESELECGFGVISHT